MVTLTDDSLVLRVGDWAQGQPPSPRKNLVAEKSIKEGWMEKWTKTKASQAEYEIMDKYWHMERYDNNIYRGQKCQIGRPLSRREEDGRKWLRRPKLCTKSCRAVLRRRRRRYHLLRLYDIGHR